MISTPARFVLLLLVSTLPATAAVLRVDGDAANGGNGSTWGSAFNTIQAALNNAAEGDELWVAEGEYPEVDTNGGSSLTMKSGVDLYGGFGGDETERDRRNPLAHISTVLGTAASQGENTPVAPIIQGADSARLDGFTVRGGRAANGGAMSNFNVSPTIANCIFVDNRAISVAPGQGVGGAIFNFIDAAPTITNCTFRENTADFAAGAIMNERRCDCLVTGCTFLNNTSHLGGAISNNNSFPEYRNCRFTSNAAVDGANDAGGGEEGFGGAVYNIGRLPDQFPGEPEVNHPTFVNCIFAKNSATGFGGAIFNSETLGDFIQCTLAGNAAGLRAGASYAFDGAKPIFLNSILWDNDPEEIFDDPNFFVEFEPPTTPAPAATTVQYCAILGGWPGTGNVNRVPEFVDIASNDIRLCPESPLIDAGRITSEVSDFQDQPRPYDGTAEPRGDGSDFDIGADEYSGDVSCGAEGAGEGGEGEGEGEGEGGEGEGEEGEGEGDGGEGEGDGGDGDGEGEDEPRFDCPEPQKIALDTNPANVLSVLILALSLLLPWGKSRF
ncbi:MAG: hypothetical protein HYZ00_05150 [Candidatus Hydrogenedentes bacterium]|nr:hypothetical protein [Candidatus Hydrogenedentota bacterium]